jgi:geranylgeranyl reductase family protein
MSEHPVAWDVIVAGAGPAGSVAALVLARAGARVALVDRSAFPRDKACGDLIGPRGVRELQGLGVRIPEAGRGSDLIVVGPTGRRARLPAYPGRTYADHGIIVPRRIFDDVLRAEAIAAGATPMAARIVDVERAADGGIVRLVADDGGALRGRFVIGADGSLSTIAHLTGLVDPETDLWGFAIRGYLDAHVPLPLLALMDAPPGRIFPGYGWLFPGASGRANIGIGLALGRHQRPAVGLRRELGNLRDRLRATGDLPPASSYGPLSGGWLRMGQDGRRVARANVLLVGDAAGLVNPLQGEGIAQAMMSGRLAAEAILARTSGRLEVPVGPAYSAALQARLGGFMVGATSIHRAMLRRPAVASASARLLTAPGVRTLVAGTWSLYMNGLADGADPRPAALGARLVQVATTRAARGGGRREGPA